jgi:hypothetical protein
MTRIPTREELVKLVRGSMEAEHLRLIAVVQGFDTAEFFQGQVDDNLTAVLAAYDALTAERDAAEARVKELEAVCHFLIDEETAGSILLVDKAVAMARAALAETAQQELEE